VPKLKLKNGGAISISDGQDLPAKLTVEGAAGTPITVELADLKEVEAVVSLIESPDEFKED
jgi:hypothetical protein